MPDPTILLCAPALDADESAAGLDVLRRVKLRGSAKFLVTTGKFDAQGDAKTVNVESDYPPEPALLQTLLRWTESDALSDPRFRDGYDLFCFRRVLSRFKKFEKAVLLRKGADALQKNWPELKTPLKGQLFVTFSDRVPARPRTADNLSLLIDLTDERWAGFLDLALELYLTGAVYGMERYSLHLALSTALKALDIEQELSRPGPEQPSPSLSLPADLQADEEAQPEAEPESELAESSGGSA